VRSCGAGSPSFAAGVTRFPPLTLLPAVLLGLAALLLAVMASAGGARQNAAPQAAGTLPIIAQPVALAPTAAKLVLAVATAADDDDAGRPASPHATGPAGPLRVAAPALNARPQIVRRILRPFAQGPPTPAV